MAVARPLEAEPPGTGSEARSLLDAGTAVLPLRAWSRHDRGRVCAAVGETMRAWAMAWGLEGHHATGPTRCESPLDEALAQHFAAGAWERGAPGMTWRVERSAGRADGGSFAIARDQARRLLFGDPAPRSVRSSAGAREKPLVADRIACEAVESFWSGLAERLGGIANGPASGADEPGVAPAVCAWSGELRLGLSWLDLPVQIRLSGDRVASVVARAPAPASPGARLVDPLEALGARRARVVAAFPPFELELGAVLGLRVGDVLRTPHDLRTLLQVSIEPAGAAPSTPLCSGFLGRTGMSRAVELLRSP